MKLVTTNKLNRLWKNGILPKLLEKLDKTRVLTSTEQVQANTNAENVVGALVAKEIINDLGQQPEWIHNDEGRIIGYKTQAGADTVFPFKSFSYDKLSTVEKYNNISASSWGSGHAGDECLNRSISKSYNIPLVNSEGRLLYGVNVSLVASIGTACLSSARWSLKTVEGKTLYSDSISGVSSVSKRNNTFCDLLKIEFDTAYNYLILDCSASAKSGSGTTEIGGYQQTGSAAVDSISASYK